MQIINKSKLSLMFGACLASIGFCHYAYAEEGPQAARGALEEVTVTARKTAENLQDTPIAISAMGAEALADAGINSVNDLTKAVPGLDIGNKGGNNAAPFIRGVGQRQNKATLDPAVAIYMDDVYLGRPDGALMDLADVAGIQVLRGPQGTLFGRNATGGAIILSPKKPTDEVEGMVLFRTGSYNRQDAQFALNTPITDNFFVRMALGQTKRDGYSENLYTGKDNFDNENRQFLLAQARWLAGDYTTIDVAYNVSKQDENARSVNCQLHPELTKVARGQGEGVDVTRYLGALSLTGLALGANYIDACYKNQKLVEQGELDKFYLSEDPKYTADASGLSFVLTHEFENFDFKSVTSWRRVSSEAAVDLDGTELTMLDQSNVGNPNTTNQYTQEFQINGYLMDGDFEYTAGAYYWQESNKDGVEVTNTGPWFLSFGNIPLVGVFRRDYLIRTTNNKSFALFGQGTYHVSDYLDITGGLRYTTETRGLEALRIDNLPDNGVLSGDAFSLFINDYDTDDDPNTSKGFLANLVKPFVDVVGGFLENDGLYENLAGIIGDLEGSYVYIPAFQPSVWDNPEDWVQDPFERIANGLTNARTEKKTNKFSAITPMINFSYYFPDNWLDWLDADSGMAYFTYSKGFRAGGLVTENTKWDPETKEHYATITPYEPEEVANFEFGTKLDLFGNLRLNAALYHMDYQNKQETLLKQNPINPLQVEAQLGNIGAATISGFEVEATYVPIEPLQLSLNLNYTLPKYSEFDSVVYPACTPPLSGDQENGGCGFFRTRENLDRSDEELPIITPFKVFAAAQYMIPTPWALMTPRIEATYKEASYQHFDRGSWLITDKEETFNTKAHTIWNANVNFDFYDEKTRVGFGVKNITDERVLTGAYALVDTFGGGNVTYAGPRMWQAEFIHRF